MKNKAADFTRLAVRFVFSTPRSVAEALWRGVSLWMVSTLIGVGWFFFNNPESFQLLLSQHPTLEQVAKGSKRKEVVDLISSFVERTKPIRIALVSRTGGVGAQLIWNSDGLDRQWPTSVDGVLSSNIRPILGHLIFNECWEGDLASDGGHYVLCGLSNDKGHVGFLIAEIEKPCQKFGADFKLLAGEIARILF